MEATGHYRLALYSALIDNNFNISVYNPYQIKSYRGVYNNRKQKNDIIDSIIIDKIFSEYKGIFCDVFGTASKQLLLKYPTPEEILKTSSTKLTNLLSKYSNGKFNKEKVKQLKKLLKILLVLNLLPMLVRLKLNNLLIK